MEEKTYIEILTKIIIILEKSLTKGKVENTFFSLNKKDKAKIKKFQNERFFSKYIISFYDNNEFRLEAETKTRDLETSVLYFDKMKKIFDALGIESAIQIQNGNFLFDFKN